MLIKGKIVKKSKKCFKITNSIFKSGKMLLRLIKTIKVVKINFRLNKINNKAGRLLLELLLFFNIHGINPKKKISL